MYGSQFAAVVGTELERASFSGGPTKPTMPTMASRSPDVVMNAPLPKKDAKTTGTLVNAAP